MTLPIVLLLLPLLVWKTRSLKRWVTAFIDRTGEHYRYRYTPLDYLRHHLLLALLSYSIVWLGTAMSLLLAGGHGSWQIFRDGNLAGFFGLWFEMVIFIGMLFYPIISGEMFKAAQERAPSEAAKGKVFEYAVTHYLQLLGYSYLLLNLYDRLMGIRILDGLKRFML